MSKTFVISDMRFNHPRMLLFAPIRIQAVIEHYDLKMAEVHELYRFAKEWNAQEIRGQVPQKYLSWLNKYSSYFDAVIVEKWNSVVDVGDIVYCLGDVSFKNNLDSARRLRGNIVMIVGNHDEHLHKLGALGWTVLLGGLHRDGDKLTKIEEVTDDNPKRSYLIESFADERVLFAHYPIDHKDKYDRGIVEMEKDHLEQVFIKNRCTLQIYGHIHTSNSDSKKYKQINVCVEQIDYAPKEIVEIL